MINMKNLNFYQINYYKLKKKYTINIEMKMKKNENAKFSSSQQITVIKVVQQ